MSSVSNAVAQREQGPAALVEQYRDDLAMVAPSHVNPDKLYRTMIGLLRGNDQLARVAAANPGSFMAAVFECAELGHRPGDTYHFVPFGGKVTGIEDYKGEIERMYRAGAVISVKAEIVYANDTYEFDEQTMDRPLHKRDRFAGKSERGEMVGVYAYAVMRGGALSRVIEMGKEEVNEHKAAANGTHKDDSPWNKWPRSMWLKTAVHELAKWVPTSNEYLTDQARAAGEAARIANQPASTPPAPQQPAEPVRAEVYTGEVITPSGVA
ncbi:RecT family recombinase [Micromonospora sp. NPDC023633]|uniref:RecT family recombinase n=1 Tax=Micromonospora sp. NPDC023633 TaxID=3154320 RepID=UPI0033F73421